MHSLKTTEKTLALFRGIKGIRGKPTRNNWTPKSHGIPKFSAVIRLTKLTNVRQQSTSATAKRIILPLINPKRISPESVPDAAIKKIKPLTMPRFPKTGVETLPSVTKILSATMPASSQFILDRWKESMIKKLGLAGFNKYQQETFERGRALHAILATYLLGRGDPAGEISQEVVSNLRKSIQKVVQDNISDVRLVEHIVTHQGMKYRGIVDCVAAYKGELVVIDFKTAEKPKKNLESLYDNPLQVTAYCAAINNDQSLPNDIIDRNICSGLVIVAYIDGSEATIHHFGREQIIDQYWPQWTTRLDQYLRLEEMKQPSSNPVTKKTKLT